MTHFIFKIFIFLRLVGLIFFTCWFFGRLPISLKQIKWISLNVSCYFFSKAASIFLCPFVKVLIKLFWKCILIHAKRTVKKRSILPRNLYVNIVFRGNLVKLLFYRTEISQLLLQNLHYFVIRIIQCILFCCLIDIIQINCLQ